MRFSLRTKLLLILLSVVGATVVIGTLAVNNRIQTGARREASTQANAHAAQAQALYRERASTLVAEGEAVSLYPAVIAAITDGNATPLLSWSGQVTQLQGTKVTVTDVTGRVIARGHAPAQSGDNLMQRLEGLRMALGGQKASGVEDGDELGPALRGYAPVRGGGNVIGAVMIADALDEKLLRRLTGDMGTTALTVSALDAAAPEDCRGNGAAASTCSFVLRSPGGSPAAQLSLSVPFAAIEDARKDSQQALGLVGGGVLVAGMLAAVVLSASLTRPLQRLTQSARAMAAGDYNEPVAGTPSGDEVGVLASAFESMRTEVNKASRALTDQRDVLDSVVESVDAGILLIESDQRTVLANRHWLELVGSPDLRGTSNLTRTGGSAGFTDVAGRWLENGTLVAQADFEEFSPTYRRLRCYTAPVIRASQSQATAKSARIYVLRDVTTETQAERMRSAFVATVSHELRSPLTAVKGYTDTLLQSGPWDDTTEREFLEIIASSAERLGVLIDNLLDASQVEAGVLRLSPEPVRIERVVESIRKQLSPRLHSHQLEVSLADGLPLTFADPVRVEQVLTNLIENAAKYAPQGGSIRVGVEARDMVSISVSDSGVGIAVEEQERVFDRFFRASTVGQIKGVGLGLYICRSLVEAHGGRIWVTSKPGSGSTFTFTLPRLEEAESPEVEKLSPEPVSVGST